MSDINDLQTKPIDQPPRYTGGDAAMREWTAQMANWTYRHLVRMQKDIKEIHDRIKAM